MLAAQIRNLFRQLVLQQKTDRPRDSRYTPLHYSSHRRWSHRRGSERKPAPAAWVIASAVAPLWQTPLPPSFPSTICPEQAAVRRLSRSASSPRGPSVSATTLRRFLTGVLRRLIRKITLRPFPAATSATSQRSASPFSKAARSCATSRSPRRRWKSFAPTSPARSARRRWGLPHSSRFRCFRSKACVYRPPSAARGSEATSSQIAACKASGGSVASRTQKRSGWRAARAS